MFRTATLILIGLSLWNPQAFAITDIFDCTAKIVDLKTNESAESVGQVAGYRMVTPNSVTGQPYPNGTEVTQSETSLSLRLNGKDSSYRVDFGVKYGFAQRSINGPEARQYTCNRVTLQRCDNNANPNSNCSVASNVCFVQPDPFDPVYGWTPINDFIHNVPAFNEKLLRPLNTIIPISEDDPNGAHVTVSCKFTGTYF